MSDDFDQQFDDDFDEDFENDEEFEDDFDEEPEEDFEEETEDFDQGDNLGEEGFEDDEQGFDDDDEEEEFDKPVSEGETVEVEIEDLGSKGDGIARVEGFVVFVPGGEVGESYEVEVTSVGRKFAFAEIAE